MKHTLKVTPKEATELMAQGYEIECYLTLPPASAPDTQTKTPRNYIPHGSKIGRSVRGTPPTQGKAAVVFADLDKKFFGDPTVTAPSDKLRAFIKAHPSGYSSMLSHLVNNYKVLRIV